jgi:type III pantothenate kinase
MEINLITLGLGNSRLAIGVFVAGNLEYANRVPVERKADWAAAIAEAWSRIKGREDPAVVGASVNPPLLEALEHAVQQATGQAVQWVGDNIDLPVKVLTNPPEKTGVDRVLVTAAAYEQMGKACAVVDAGTAITVNLCNDKGEFLGGAIAPGVGMWLQALHARTAALPEVEFAIPEGLIGRSTEQALLQGVYHGIRGMVKELVENYATELGSWPDLIATGGDAERLFGGWELVHAVSPDLGLYGIALAYTEHHIKHGM